MVIKKVDLEIVIGVTSEIPETDKPEVAFAGKSNVGKSSLINALMNRKSYARISAQPGKTQTINFYNINDAMFLVDLPGYGYANANQEVKAKWGKMIEKYLINSQQLKQVFLLIDIRHDPSENDKIMYDWIVSNGFRPVIVATKLDKINRSQVPQHVKMIRQGLGLRKDDILVPFSSLNKQGLEELWQVIDHYILGDELSESIVATSEGKALTDPEYAALVSAQAGDRTEKTAEEIAKERAQKAALYAKPISKSEEKQRRRTVDKENFKAKEKAKKEAKKVTKTKPAAKSAVKSDEKSKAKSAVKSDEKSKAKSAVKTDEKSKAKSAVKSESRYASKDKAKSWTKDSTTSGTKSAPKYGSKDPVKTTEKRVEKGAEKSGHRSAESAKSRHEEKPGMRTRTSSPKAEGRSDARSENKGRTKAATSSGTRSEGRGKTSSGSGSKTGSKPAGRSKR